MEQGCTEGHAVVAVGEQSRAAVAYGLCRLNGLRSAHNVYVFYSFVAVVVAEDVLQVVFTLLVEVDNATCVVGFNERQAVAWLKERLKVPRPMTGKILVVAPHVYHSVALLGYVVHIAFAHQLAVAVKLGVAYAVAVIHAVHVVVSPYAEANLTPRLVAGLSERADATFLRVLEDALPTLRIALERVGGGCLGVGNDVREPVQRVHQIARCRLVHFQM